MCYYCLPHSVKIKYGNVSNLIDNKYLSLTHFPKIYFLLLMSFHQTSTFLKIVLADSRYSLISNI